MLYCPKCCAVTEEEVCPSCSSRDLRIPEDGDWVHIRTERENAEPSAFCILQEKGIPARKEPEEQDPSFFRIQVPFGRLSSAAEILQAVPSGEKPLSRAKRSFWKAFSLVLFLLLIALTVYATDFVAGWFRSLLS